MTYEYATRVISRSSQTIGQTGKYNSTISELNTEGAKGWKVVAMLPTKDTYGGSAVEVYFMREKTNDFVMIE